jgi:hypothetical protein
MLLKEEASLFIHKKMLLFPVHGNLNKGPEEEGRKFLQNDGKFYCLNRA